MYVPRMRVVARFSERYSRPIIIATGRHHSSGCIDFYHSCCVFVAKCIFLLAITMSDGLFGVLCISFLSSAFDGTSYGSAPQAGTSWKSMFLKEVESRID
jgi:hypothetical protein